MVTRKSRSPLKAKPLRNPGQSVAEFRHRLFEEKLEEPAIWAIGLLVLAIQEIVGWYWDLPRHPVVFGVMALIALAFLIWRIRTVKPKMRNLAQAVEGEMAVGQFLENLRAIGYKVFHDIPGEGFNVDHVIIGPAGAFTVETKTWSLPPNSRAEISFDGEKLLRAGLKPDRDPVAQARAQISWLRELLEESTGRTFPVRGIILIPGWYVTQGEVANRELWVLNPKRLLKFLRREPERLPPEDVSLASSHLGRYIRSLPATA